jgi:hypothetical protein
MCNINMSFYLLYPVLWCKDLDNANLLLMDVVIGIAASFNRWEAPYYKRLS